MAKSDKTKTSQSQENGIASGLAIASGVAAAPGEGKETFIPALTTPATPLDVSGSGTPLNGANGGANGANANGTPGRGLARAAGTRGVDDSFGTQHRCPSSILCYKQGRITIPPAIVLAANGFYAVPESASASITPTSTSSTGQKPQRVRGRAEEAACAVCGSELENGGMVDGRRSGLSGGAGGREKDGVRRFRLVG
ncbi:hypothetical protein K438DRAFT_1975094 [Mycena galopus ATCC 62051]|nr:hypothetical protein K438DRAFT_1975094 [Mycena galopus ATCC 62051]